MSFLDECIHQRSHLILSDFGYGGKDIFRKDVGFASWQSPNEREHLRHGCNTNVNMSIHGQRNQVTLAAVSFCCLSLRTQTTVQLVRLTSNGLSPHAGKGVGDHDEHEGQDSVENDLRRHESGNAR